MSKNDRILELELELEEALQMLRLAADNKRTCLEIKDWLEINYPDEVSKQKMINELFKNDR